MMYSLRTGCLCNTEIVRWYTDLPSLN